jgi:hypothetical protein
VPSTNDRLLHLLRVERLGDFQHALGLEVEDVAGEVAVRRVAVVDRPAPGGPVHEVAVGSECHVVAREQPGVLLALLGFAEEVRAAVAERLAGVPGAVPADGLVPVLAGYHRPDDAVEQFLLRLGVDVTDLRAVQGGVVHAQPLRRGLGAVVEREEDALLLGVGQARVQLPEERFRGLGRPVGAAGAGRCGHAGGGQRGNAHGPDEAAAV